MEKKIAKVLETFKKDFNRTKTLEQLEVLRKDYTGKDSELNTFLKQMKELDVNEKQKIGKLVNEARIFVVDKINELQQKFQQEKLQQQLASEKIDVSLPMKKYQFGTKHPLNLVIDEVYQIFSEIGFQIVSGTEVEEDLYNFQKLNLPLGHPARDMQDTFYLSSDEVLRTHATNMTARMLTELSKTNTSHLAAVSLGNVYRRDDDDATHSHQFMQIDGFAVGKKISFANLK
jgi:phenylalanyl-tRNA synthetase alpha chain